MEFLPVFLKIAGRNCLVVGGGDVASRKVNLLLRASGKVTVVAPEMSSALQRLSEAGDISTQQVEFSDEHLENISLVVAASNDQRVNKCVHDLASQKNIPVNVVDQPDLCTFIFPSIVDRSPVIVAVSTCGASPVLARLLRARLETLIPASYGRLATLLAGFREQVRKRFSSMPERRHFWEKILQGPVVEMVFSGKEAEAEHTIQSSIDAPQTSEATMGEVYLVGAGPGDPDLLTFRALRLMQKADVVLFDRLVPEEIVDLTRRDAERIYVGKKRDFHALRQEEISKMMVTLAKEGKKVVRLKGGDPFIFGRGGEEIEVLAQHGIAFQVVPGITAASGCASYAGIPLTHRDYAQSVVFVTGHLQDGTVNLDWEHLVQPRQTLVIYMGLYGVEVLSRELISHGLDASTPVALVQQGTTQHQRVMTGNLETIAAVAQASGEKKQTLIIVGDVVKLQQRLAWFHPDASSQ